MSDLELARALAKRFPCDEDISGILFIAGVPKGFMARFTSTSEPLSMWAKVLQAISRGGAPSHVRDALLSIVQEVP